MGWAVTSLLAEPDIITSTVAEIEGIGSTVRAAGADADEVSQAIANFLGT